MRFLARLEKQKFTWILIVLCTVFFFLRLPSIIEPYWYGDEGVYEVIGQSMDHGRLLYRDIWDNKPPLIYTIYAAAQGDQQIVKSISLIVGILSILCFYFLIKKLFNNSVISGIITTLFVVLLGTPILEGNIANAEIFMLPFTISAGLIIYQIANKKAPIPLLAGLLLGIAFLFKTVALFDFAAFFLFFCIINLPKKIPLQKIKKSFTKIQSNSLILDLCFLILGFLLPLVLTSLYFLFNNAFLNFFQAVFLGNVTYVAWNNSLLGIPNGLLLLKCLLLVVGIGLLIWKRNVMSKQTLFISLWLLFSLFNVFFSERPYTHYLIELLPSFCLLLGLLAASKMPKERLSAAVGIVIVLLITEWQFQFNIVNSIRYYQNAIQFVTDHKSVVAYQSFFDPKTPRDYALASLILHDTKPSDKIFIWGNSPQIYVLAHKLPPGKYTVAYHVIYNNALSKTQTLLNKTKPKYIIALDDSQTLPFDLPLYIMQYNIAGATIYERSF
jgi:hypothetical protein